jgi:hypothetical protein
MGKKKPIIYHVDHTVLEVLMKDLNLRENQGTEDKLRPSVIVYREPTSRLVIGALFSIDSTVEYPTPGPLPTNASIQESEAS